MEDIELLDAILKKEKRSFDSFYQRYALMIQAQVYSRIHDQHIVEDIVQDFWVRLWEDPSWLKCNNKGSAKDYITNYFKYRILDFYRKTLQGTISIEEFEIICKEDTSYSHILEELEVKELFTIIEEVLSVQHKNI